MIQNEMQENVSKKETKQNARIFLLVMYSTVIREQGPHII